MDTQNINKNTAAPSVTIAPRRLAPGLVTFVVTLTTVQDVRSYPCRSMDSASNLAQRFVAGITKPRPDASPAAPAPQPTLELPAS